MNIELPCILGRYQLVERLGWGGSCEVFRAVYRGDSGFQKDVAIKVLLPSHRGNPELERQFVREARLGAKLEHQNLVGVEDFGVDRGIRYLRMELVEGYELRELMEHSSPDAAVGLFICAQITLGLRYLHAQSHDGKEIGLVHRDVSPSNVLISPFGEVKLADFGILKATRRRHLTRAGVRKGTISYMSPEQARGEQIDPRSDQFPVGVLLCVLATGEHPLEAEDRIETLERIRTADVTHLDKLPPDLRGVAERCLSEAPEDRYPDMTALYRDIEKLRRSRAPAGPLSLPPVLSASDVSVD